MSMKKANIGGFMYDVISTEEFERDPASCTNKYTAVDPGDGFIYPVRGRNDHGPGFYPTGGLDFFVLPTGNECTVYSQQHVIDFHSPTNYRELIQAQQKLASTERSILTTIDSVFAPEIGDNDTPEMKVLKQAIIDKHIDLDKYEPRFGPNYNNDKRLLRKDRVTFAKLRDIGNALDMKVTITIEDARPDVPNPIGRVITAEITGANATLEEDEE